MGKGAKTRKKDTTCVVSFFLQELVKIDIFKDWEQPQENWQTGLLSGGAFAPYERFAAGKTSAQGEFISPEHFNHRRVEPPSGRRNPKRRTSAFSRCPSFWYGHRDLNPDACAREPKSRMSANSIMPA